MVALPSPSPIPSLSPSPGGAVHVWWALFVCCKGKVKSQARHFRSCCLLLVVSLILSVLLRFYFFLLYELNSAESETLAQAQKSSQNLRGAGNMLQQQLETTTNLRQHVARPRAHLVGCPSSGCVPSSAFAELRATSLGFGCLALGSRGFGRLRAALGWRRRLFRYACSTSTRPTPTPPQSVQREAFACALRVSANPTLPGSTDILQFSKKNRKTVSQNTCRFPV